MAEALISRVLDRLASVAEEQIHLVVGVDDEIESLKDTLQSIQDVVEDAERKQVKEKSVRRWLEQLKTVAYQMDDVVDEWCTALLLLQMEAAETSASSSKKRKVTGSILSHFPNLKLVSNRHGIGNKIKSIKQQLDAIDGKRKMFNFAPIRIEKPLHPVTTSRVDFSEVCGRDIDQKTIIGHLLGEKGEQSSGFYVVSIVGTGGMGKTTLAQLAFNHPDVKAHFDQRIWVCVSDPFEPARIFRDIVEILEKTSPDLHNLEALQQKVETCISQKKFLLVLDDVWTEDYRLWDQVKSTLLFGAGGSRILATTRKDTVAKMMGSTYKHQLGGLSQQLSQELFSRIAFSINDKAEEFKEIGKGIADRCKGLPLAIKTMGVLMRSKNSIEEWEAVLHNELWEEEAFERDISPGLWLSYYNLSPAIKRCFSFCAVFPKDTVMKRDELIQLWMAHNYLKPNGNKEMEMIGREYFEHLAAASFFQDFEKDEDSNVITCKMHDIVHDFAQLLTKGECFIIDNDKQSEKSAENSHHATFIVKKDGENTFSPSSMKDLHTMLVSNPIYCRHAPLLFQHLTCLRALSLGRGCLVQRLSDEVGQLIHLRYLDLSYCEELKELPETICNLHNLQTLNIRGCSGLERLPQAIGKLTNLRHIQNCDAVNLLSLPKGIAGMNSLQTVEWFIISRDGDEKCKIGYLRNLNKLRGELFIVELSEVEDAREVEEAELERKIHIQKLTLQFGIGKKTKKDVAEAIKLPPKLKDLSVWYYEEVELPGWMMRSLSLTHLRRLEVIGLSECSGLPPWGELPALEHLEINSIRSVKYVGDEFVGSSSSSTAFPKLKRLSFAYMFQWEKWEVKEDQRRLVMPSLEVLELTYCPKLEALPDHLLQRTELHGLWSIKGCPVLELHYANAFPNLKFSC